MTSSTSSTSSARAYIDVAAPEEDVDLLELGGAPCRAIRPLETGTLVVVNRAGVERALAVTQNVDEEIRATTIKAATDVDRRVYF